MNRTYLFSALQFSFFSLFIGTSCLAQQQKGQDKPYVSKVWVSDQGDGTYKNPVLHSDYSDPDVVRVGDDFYMTASSFNAVPGLPILHSKDLVNWKLVNYALERQPPFEHFSKPQHGNGVWAPSIRYHDGEYYIYYGDPDFGIYMVKTKDPAGDWEAPVLVEEGKGLIDPSPLWDDDGKAYLSHAFAGSRAGIKSVLVVKEMNPEGTKVISPGVMVFDGHKDHPTIEGTKFDKRNGYYYIFAPGGGVSTGWQVVLRSKNVYGPYEDRIVLAQGDTEINGPHQGALVELENGENWFLHFQDKEAYGRIVHMQPVKWVNDWPVIGEDKDGDGIGQPVMSYKKPNVSKSYPIETPVESDEFNDNTLGLQWQWHANPKPTWAFTSGAEGVLRLFTDQKPEGEGNIWNVPNLLLQKFPAEEFTATTKFSFYPNEKLQNERTGLIVMGENYAYLSVVSKDDGTYLTYNTVTDNARKGGKEKETIIGKVNPEELYFRVEVMKGAKCQFSYSENGKRFKKVGEVLNAVPGRWIGAKVGVFALREDKINDSGYANYDWFRITK